MAHAQNVFNPMIHGLADYWFPGEHLQALGAAGKAWLYTDDVPENIYQTEFNSRMLGPAVIFLPALTNYRKELAKPEYTEAMMTMLLLNDITSSTILCDRNVVVKVWDIYRRFDMDKAAPHLYWEQQELSSSNPKVKISYYDCPESKRLIVVGNPSPTEQKAVIVMKPGDYSLKDEYSRRLYEVKGGRVEMTIPPRMFAVLSTAGNADK